MRKKIRITRKKAALTETGVEQRTNVEFWKSKTADDLAQEQNVKPVSDAKDFQERYLGGLEDWNDIDEFLKEVHRPSEKHAK